jgi:signal transduction histidine kinase
MLQEIMHNAMRHAKANNLSIAGRIEGPKLTIHTSDDGTGFDPYGIREPRGLGLQNLSLRAGMIGAKLWINSSVGAGTQHTIELFINES